MPKYIIQMECLTTMLMPSWAFKERPCRSYPSWNYVAGLGRNLQLKDPCEHILPDELAYCCKYIHLPKRDTVASKSSN
jgi:hypothetical protein